MQPCTIVMYHYVREREGELGALRGITPEQFSGQIAALKKMHTIISLKEYLSSEQLPKNPCVLTFDDGLKDHISTVLPILQEHSATATFFINTAPLRDYRVLDVHKVHILLALCSSLQLGNEINQLLRSDFPQLYKDFEIRDGEKRDPRYRFDDVFTANLKYTTNNLPRVARNEILSKLFFKYCGDERTFSESFYMNADAIRQLQTVGMEIGSHSHSHEKLTNLGSNEVKDDIEIAHHTLTEILGREPSLFSYPYGNVSDEIEAIIRENKYRGAVGTSVGTNETNQNIFRLERVNTNDMPFN